ncbi:DNA damage-induced apoptosis suppressor protein isoform X2 [Sceloporus undulatus]|uniref:DNA damage-induced apoptosis suppressor protein isoform X2 n=1 Tax=Sceloporus undulatus TaxID=8520 RepID=UPI001C4D6A64|nr:DNA damage-induced apoptosis suppressor protein isoform X2 [Sceloporus undulatus]
MNGRRLLVASVISVQNSPFIYPSCQNCFSKLLLDFERYSCLKCGCSGDSKEANYRYRLSLEVADTQSVFEVTVFGSCLDVYFGVTAKGLQRYIEKLCQEVGESDKDATPDVLFHAVESCFIGKKFVFGVKDYYKPESTTSLQNDCQTNSSQESHQDAFYSSLSSNGKKKLVCLSHQQPLLLPSSSLMEVKPPHSEESCLKSEEGVDQDISSSKNCHSISCLKCSSKCLENSCLQARYTTACLNSKDDGMKKEKGNIFVNLNQSTEITKIQGDISTSGTCKKSSGVGEPKEDLLFQVDGCSFKVDDGSFLQKCSDSHELSFNASADLFDSTRETEATVGKLNSAQEDPLTKQCITSEFTPRELNGSWNKSSSSSMLTISDSKRNSPVTGLISGSEHTPSGSLDFIPNSQSTPLARPCLQVRLPRGKESILSELPLNKLSWVGAKCKRLRPALGNPSVKRLVSKFLQCRRTSEASDCQQIWANDSPAQRMSENVDEEWIPPSEKKQVQPLGIQNGKVLKRRRNLVRNSADCPAVEKATLSKNKVRCEIPRSPTRLMRVELSPKNPTVLRFERHPMYKDDASCRQIVNGSPGFSAFSNVKSNLSSTPCPMANVTHPMANVTSWSLELFTDNSQLLSMDALFPTPSA